jgi:predicted ATPase
MHAQAEGVPFILGEQAQAYHEAGLIQQIDGVWTLGRNAERMLPTTVRTLIQRRVARLPKDTKDCLADAAILGQSFSLRDLHYVRERLGSEPSAAPLLAEALSTAVAADPVQHPDGSADFSHARPDTEFAQWPHRAAAARIHGVIAKC